MGEVEAVREGHVGEVLLGGGGGVGAEEAEVGCTSGLRGLGVGVCSCCLFVLKPADTKLVTQRNLEGMDDNNFVDDAIFLTGGSGFLGTALAYKIITSTRCPKLVLLCRGGSR